MENAIIIIAVLAAIAAAVAYGEWLKKGIQARNFSTSLSADQVRDIFAQKVGGRGWKIVDDGNPMVAQSNLATGIRQQIELRTAVGTDNQTVVRVAPARIVVKGFFLKIPRKGHTLRMRMDAFTKAVTAVDAEVTVERTALRAA